MSSTVIPGKESKPYLSVVATARNDDHGGNLVGRMQVFVNALIGQAKRHQVPLELILVEWNPPPEKPPLVDALTWPEDLGPCEVRIIEVPPEVHGRFQHAAFLPLYQMIAKNVGIRRARGEFVLATNIDIVFSDEFFQLLAEKRLERGKMYRVDRHDVASDIPIDGDIDDQLAYCRSHLLRINTREGTFPVTPGGLPVLAAKDVADADSGVFFGTGWYPVEGDGERHFRWVNNDARVTIDAENHVGDCLAFDLEPGPGVRNRSFLLQIFDAGHNLLKQRAVSRRTVVKLPASTSPQATLFLRAIGGGSKIRHDPRTLNFRVFRCGWKNDADDDAADQEEAADGLGADRRGILQKLGQSLGRMFPGLRAGRLSLPVPKGLLDSLEPRVERGRLSIGLRGLRDLLPEWLVSRMPSTPAGFSDGDMYVLWGKGWYPLEFHSGLLFRWGGRQAEWVLYMPEVPSATLALLLEPGPAVGFEPFHLQVKDSAGSVVATAVVERLKWIFLSLPWRPGESHVFSLCAEGGGPPTFPPREERDDLCFRIFQCGWVGVEEGLQVTQHPPPWRESLILNQTVVPSGDGLLLGAGWGPVESQGDRLFRRGQEGSEILVFPDGSGEARIHLDMESLSGSETLDLRITDSEGRDIACLVVDGREVKAVSLPLDHGKINVLRLCRAFAKGTDSREDLFRLFRCGWGDAAPSTMRSAQAKPSAQPHATAPDALQAAESFGGGLVVTDEMGHDEAKPGPLIPDWRFTDPGQDGPIHLHTNACGDFTLLAREHWFDLRGYPEFDLFSMNIDSVFCYTAHYGGAEEEVLEDPIRIYHIEHGVGSGWTPEGQAALFERIAAKGLSWIDYHELLGWARQMHRLRLPMIFNREHWGLNEVDLRERTIAGKPLASEARLTRPEA